MAERPIIFSAPMVLAILAGRKTQTRRVIKPQPSPGDWFEFTDGRLFVHETSGDAAFRTEIPCRYGRVGDKLWVKETFGTFRCDPRKVVYKADHSFHPLGASNPMKPSIHMPRWASRITLEITGIRAERLHDISEADAKAEGVVPALAEIRCTHEFYLLWEKIHGPGSWAKNPWLWVISFRRIEPNSEPIVSGRTDRT